MLYHKIIIRLLVTIALAGFSHCALAKWYYESWTQMGTNISANLWAETSTTANAAIAAVKAEMKRIDFLMSPYIENSELAQINRDAAKQPVKISAEMFQIIQIANRISKKSGGIFDITFASVGHMYDYRKKIRPSNATIDSLLPAINYRHLVLNKASSSIYFDDARVVIDLGGIAKGHAVESSIAILRKMGIRHAAVTAGGDSMMLGDKRGKPWIVGIQDPRDKQKNAVILPIANIALSTSGDYERFFIENGTRFHHIISPKTGRPATYNRSVSIMGKSATITDALSTTLFILPFSKALKIIDKYPGYDAIIIDNQGNLHYSEGLRRSK